MISKRTLRQLKFAETYGARIVQPFHDGTVVLRLEVSQDRHAGRRGYPFRVAEVLERDRYSMQCATVPVPHDIRFGFAGLFQRQLWCR